MSTPPPTAVVNSNALVVDGKGPFTYSKKTVP
jgi:hypothetical protein